MIDTASSSDMKMIGEIYLPEMVLIPIGSLHLGATQFNPYEPASTISGFKAKIAIPTHFGAKKSGR